MEGHRLFRKDGEGDEEGVSPSMLMSQLGCIERWGW